MDKPEEPKKRGRPKGSVKQTVTQNFISKKGSRFTPEKIVECKEQIVELIQTELADNITEACDKLGISKIKAHEWARSDPAWADAIKLAQEVVADRLEAVLDRIGAKHPIALIFRLKKLRPEYRDTFHVDVTSSTLEKLLKELKQLARPSIQIAEVSAQTKLPELKEATIEAQFRELESTSQKTTNQKGG